LKHLALINREFVKHARPWEELSRQQQYRYVDRHPKTKRRITYLEQHGVFDGPSYLLPNHPWGVLIRKDPKLLKKWHTFINKNITEDKTYKDLLSVTNDHEVWGKALNDFKATKPITVENAQDLINKYSDQISGGKTMDYLFEKSPGEFREKIIMPVLKKIYEDVSIKDIIAFARDAVVAAAALSLVI